MEMFVANGEKSRNYFQKNIYSNLECFYLLILQV